VVTVKSGTSFARSGFILLLKLMISKGVLGVSSVQISSLVQLTDKAISRTEKIIFLNMSIISRCFFFPKVQHFLHEKFEGTYQQLETC
jgi:hypothetical protein